MDNSEGRPRPKKRRIKRKWRLFFYAVFWVFILAVFSGLIITQASHYNTLRSELERINAAIAREAAIFEDLQHQMLFFDSYVYIEELARERLGMVRPNEIVFRNRAD
jgi:cell division protein FtsB